MAKKEVAPEEKINDQTGISAQSGSVGHADAQWKNASSLIWQPEAGQCIIGVYDGAQPFTEGTLDAEVLKHFVKCKDDKGMDRRYTFVGGSSFDKLLEATPEIRPGVLVRIEYLGKKALKKDGKHVNLWDLKYAV